MRQEAEALTELASVKINKIKLGRNSRLNVDPEELAGLMQSIKETGLLQPIGLVPNGDGFEIAYGNRRFLAVSKLGWSEVPAVIKRNTSHVETDLQNLTENMQRRNPGIAEFGRYIMLLREQGLSLAECAVRLGVAPKFVESCVRAYRDIPPKYRELLEVRMGNEDKNQRTKPGKISISQANAILNSTKALGLSVEQRDQLFEVARENGTGFRPESVHQYALAVLEGKDPMKATKAIRRILLTLMVGEEQIAALSKKYVDDGPFRSVPAVLRAVVRGELAEKIEVFGR